MSRVTAPLIAAGLIISAGAALAAPAAPSAVPSPSDAAANATATAAHGLSGLPPAAVSQFDAAYGVPIQQDSTPAAVPAAIDSAPPTARLRALQRLTSDNGMTWHKVYTVTPADVAHPVTTLADARALADQAAPVSLSGDDLPAVTAFKSIASADDATVVTSGFEPRNTLDIDLIGASVAQAIADVAGRTHTHWQAAYVVRPLAGSVAARAAFRPRVPLTQQQYEETQLFNGPFTEHVPPAPPTPVPTTNVSSATNPASGASGQNGGAQVVTPNGISPASATGAIPNSNGYASQYGGYGAYGYAPQGYNAYGGYGPYGYGSPYAVTGGGFYQMGNPYSSPYSGAPDIITTGPSFLTFP